MKEFGLCFFFLSFFFLVVGLICVPFSSFFVCCGISLGYFEGSRASLKIMEGKRENLFLRKGKFVSRVLGYLSSVFHVALTQCPLGFS